MQDFKFLKNDSIGSPDAEEDTEYLEDCFIDTGDLQTLTDMASPRRIAVGRTGSGKTALIQHLISQEDEVIEVDPEHLSLHYLSNSTILPYLEELGVNLDLFYRVLWRHVFSVELIKKRYGIKSPEDRQGLLDRIWTYITKNEKRQKAIEYLMDWGDSFWEDTDVRIREVSQQFEKALTAEIGGSLKIPVSSVTSKIGEKQSISESDRQEIVKRAQEVVNRIQIRQLSEVTNVLAEIFPGPQPKYFIAIDGLDDSWVADQFRYKLIRALIETVRDYRKIPCVKIVVALRRDLLEHVIRVTRDTGFQEEKYEGLYMPITWTGDQLLRLLDERVSKLVRRRYTSKKVGWRDLLPVKVREKRVDKYILERTQYRPRDVIAFFNCCIEASIDNPKITVNRLRTAEGVYSRKRLRALSDEWQRECPLLLSFVEILKRRKPTFLVSEISEENIEKLCLSMVDMTENASDTLGVMAWKYASGSLDVDQFRATFVKVLFNIGVIGVRLTPDGAISWAFRQHERVSEAEITSSTVIAICPMLYRVLGVDTQEI